MANFRINSCPSYEYIAVLVVEGKVRKAVDRCVNYVGSFLRRRGHHPHPLAPSVMFSFRCPTGNQNCCRFRRPTRRLSIPYLCRSREATMHWDFDCSGLGSHRCSLHLRAPQRNCSRWSPYSVRIQTSSRLLT